MAVYLCYSLPSWIAEKLLLVWNIISKFCFSLNEQSITDSWLEKRTWLSSLLFICFLSCWSSKFQSWIACRFTHSRKPLGIRFFCRQNYSTLVPREPILIGSWSLPCRLYGRYSFVEVSGDGWLISSVSSTKIKPPRWLGVRELRSFASDLFRM